jgi:glycosyltransferase involved in cell wall biosynthesis
MEKLVRKKQGEESFDAVVAFAIGPSGGIASYVQEMRGMPRVVEDLELTIIKDRIDIQPHWYQQLRLRLTWWKLRNYTTRLLRDIDGYTVASVKERDLLLSILPNCQLQAVIPNGVDLALYNGDFGPTEPDSLVFPGALTYEANLGAIKLFLAKVFPIVKTRCPGVKLYITGRTDGVRLQDLPSHNGVVLTGYLDDIRPRVSCSSVCVVPMTVGGGTRLKVLEAMALGTPVVSTNKGAEGLEVAAEQNILIADEPTEFANAILRLLDDPALRAKLAANGQKLVHEQYSWERIGEDLDRFLHQVLSEHKLQGAA